jgi:hypothetical protein
MLRAVEGIYRNGEIELFERPQDLSEARVIVTFLAKPQTSREELRQRMLARMREGLALGGPPYPSREEIYDRSRRD